MIYERVIKVLSQELRIHEEDFERDLLLVDDLEVDDEDFIEVIMSLEDEFCMELPDKEVYSNLKRRTIAFDTVGDLVDYIESKVNE